MVSAMDGSIARYIVVFLVSLLPTVEVRGSIPLVFILFTDDTSIVFALAIAVLGNLLIAPIVLSVLGWLDTFILNSRIVPSLLKALYLRVLGYVRSQASRINRYSLPALIVFVAIPLPGTGAWTGSLAAYILGIERRRALLAIELGVLIASLLVISASILGVELIKRIFML